MRSPAPVLLGALALSATTAVAQIPPPCNTYPILLVDSTGVAAPTTGSGLQAVASIAVEEVYMSFANLPDGTHRLYVHVTDRLDGITDEVLSTNDPADRFVDVAKTNGVVDISLPFTNNQDPNIIVTLPNGNEILRITPVRNALTEPCLFKAWMGNTYSLNMPGGASNPYIVRPNSNDPSCFTAYHYFRVGDSVPGSDVYGTAFEDLDRDGVLDSGEGPLANWEVRLVTGTTAVSTLTDANGAYRFPNVDAGSYTVELVMQESYEATRTAAYAVETCGCADQPIDAFAAAAIVRNCDARTIGFWRNRHGVALVRNLELLDTLEPLCLANTWGTLCRPPQSICEWQWYLHCANSINMAYMLSAQLLAMHSNVIAGFVDPECRINDPVLGNLTIEELMDRAIDALCRDGFTPPGDRNRAAQTALKNALDRANNNLIWL